MSVNGISNLNGYKPIYSRKSQENNQTPVSFGYGSDNYQSSVANSYIQKQQAQKQQMELEKQKKDKWIQFGMDVLKGVTIGSALIAGTALIVGCTKAGREMAQSLTNNIGLTSADGSNKLNDTFAKAKPNVKKEDVIAGISNMPLTDEAKRICENALISANNDAVTKVKSLSNSTSSGLCLYGLPGVGKSFSAKEFANIFGAKYTEIDVNSLMSKYVGESSHNIDRMIGPAINEAREHPETPYFIIIDEADALLNDQEDSSGVKTDMRNIFLQRMDSDKLPHNLKYILTTNYPEKITPAALRTGRLRAVKINNPRYDKLGKIYQDNLEKSFAEKLENKEDLEKIIQQIPSKYPVLGPAHIKAVTEELNSILLHSDNDKLNKDDIEQAFRSAHQKAYTEYFQRCNAIVPSQTTSYDVDKNNIEYAKNLAKVCLLAADETPDTDMIELLANNIPIELMPKAIEILKQANKMKPIKSYIDSLIMSLNSLHFNINLQMDNLQDKIDKKT